MGRITTTIPDDVDDKMREMIIELVGVRNMHGSITKFVSYAIKDLVSEIEKGNKDLRQKVLVAIQK